MSTEFKKAIAYLFIVCLYVYWCNICVLARSFDLREHQSNLNNITKTPSQSNTSQSDNVFSSKTKQSDVKRSKRSEQLEDRLSDIKCREYSEMTRDVMWLKKSKPIPIRLRCKKLINLLVIGGAKAEPKEYPHMAALGWTLDDYTTEYFCGGSLISERWILTAAHCTHGNRGPPDVALLGSANLNSINNLNTGKLMTINSIVTHPDYNPPQIYDDLALLELSEPVEFSKTIKPACLYSISDSDPKVLWVSGWGSQTASSFDSGMTNLNLTKARLQLIDTQPCDQMYEEAKLIMPYGIDPESQLCAGDKRGGWKKDTCAGDSGVPLQSPHPLGCLQEIVAVTSFGLSCGFPEVPGVYTKISYYIDWIESIVWSADRDYIEEDEDHYPFMYKYK